MYEVMTKVLVLKVFPYIVKEVKESNSKSNFFSVPHLAGRLWEPYLTWKLEFNEMIGEMGSAKYYHNIICKESFKKMNETKKGNI